MWRRDIPKQDDLDFEPAPVLAKDLEDFIGPSTDVPWWDDQNSWTKLRPMISHLYSH